MKIKICPTKLGLNKNHFTSDNCVFEVKRITYDGRFVIYTPSEIYLNSEDFEVISSDHNFDIEVD